MRCLNGFIRERCDIAARWQTESISNEVTLTFNSTSEKIDSAQADRTHYLAGRPIPEDRNVCAGAHRCRHQSQIDRVSFTIDLAISNDF